MRRNGMCPLCFIRKIFTRPKKVGNIYNTQKYDNKVALTPPMGWSSWNTFKNNIDEDLIFETGKAMAEKQLIQAGYKYINLDDCWHSSMRDENGELQGDLTRFRSGIPSLVKKLNDLGLKVGIYSSNGTLTCEDLPASLDNEEKDAYTFAKWGIEYFKYDFCHNEKYPDLAPTVYGIEVVKKGEKEGTFYACTNAVLSGLARFMPCKKLVSGCYVSGLDRCEGAMQFNNVTVSENGEYVLTLCCKKGNTPYEKFLEILVNNEDEYYLKVPPQKFWNDTSRTQIVVNLKKGQNVVRLFNPVSNRADSAMIQYRKMGRALTEASKRVASENNKPEKPIVFSICEWGVNKPWQWGKLAGNLWRTTYDIRPSWFVIVRYIYERNVKLYKYSETGAWNDPDMLEVGNGKLTDNQNKSHFAVWCMMASPLILGNDLRNISDKVLKIVTNKDLIAIDQDALGKACKRIVKSGVDVLARPLTDNRVAVCFFNKGKLKKKAKLNIKKLIEDDYIGLKSKESYSCREVYSQKCYDATDELNVSLDSYASEVIILS